MKNEKIAAGTYVFVIANNRSVTEAVVVDNSQWGVGYVTLRDEAGGEFVADSDRCFLDRLAADRATHVDALFAH